MKKIFDELREQMEKVKTKVSSPADVVWNNAVKMCLREVDEAEAKWESECCEWQETERLRQKGICYGSDGLYKPSCNNDEDDFRDWNWIRHFKFCPYCAKRIKISEVK